MKGEFLIMLEKAQCSEKTKALIDHILTVCEEQGLSESDVKEIPSLLQIELKKILSKKSKTNVFHR